MQHPTTVEECRALPLVTNYTTPARIQWGPALVYNVCLARDHGDFLLIVEEGATLQHNGRIQRLEEAFAFRRVMPNLIGNVYYTQEARHLGNLRPPALMAHASFLRLCIEAAQHVVERVERWRRYWVALRERNFGGIQTAEHNRSLALYYAAVLATAKFASALELEATRMMREVSGVDSLLAEVLSSSAHLRWVYDRLRPDIVELLVWIWAQDIDNNVVLYT
ncbi:hypothetical protein QCA50_007498 [Cerrena zonata]|uniref:Uncharacterized protein n=1 Tax=Cerrena zonata TaxID=2478898 RepID=A0AAW0GHK7_9APHY